jgi:hypothetical protein
MNDAFYVEQLVARFANSFDLKDWKGWEVAWQALFILTIPIYAGRHLKRCLGSALLSCGESPYKA